MSHPSFTQDTLAQNPEFANFDAPQTAANFKQAQTDQPINPYANAHLYQMDQAFDLFDETLIAKYNQTGPRYTSYPTALEFAPIDPTAEAQILQNRHEKTPLSLYLHIPFCRHLCYYCACNKIISKKNSEAGDYLELLFAEIRQKRALIKGDPTVEQVHFGGGTPTFLSDEELVKLWQFLKQEFRFSDQKTADFSIEIDPRALRPNTLAILRQLGFNRISFGVQDLDERVQIAVNRLQPEDLIWQVMNQARALQFASINMDLIYGLPHQTPQSLQNTVEKIIQMAPDRLSVFNYAHLPDRFKAQRQIQAETLPDPASKLAMLKNTITALTQAGYQYIGIDHFAKPQDELARAQQLGNLHRNFQGYTTHGDCDLLGFGVSAISQIGEDYLQNSPDLATYRSAVQAHNLPAIKRIKTRLSDRLRRYVIMNLLCHNVMDFRDLNARFGIDAITYFARELATLHAMQQDGLVSIDAMGVKILPKGRLLGRNIAMVFDEFLSQKHQNRFSKVI